MEDIRKEGRERESINSVNMFDVHAPASCHQSRDYPTDGMTRERPHKTFKLNKLLRHLNFLPSLPTCFSSREPDPRKITKTQDNKCCFCFCSFRWSGSRQESGWRVSILIVYILKKSLEERLDEMTIKKYNGAAEDRVSKRRMSMQRLRDRQEQTKSRR